MGNSVSCLDPGREPSTPPVSWAKDHPGRAEAIAEFKKRRSTTQFSNKREPAPPAQPTAPQDERTAEFPEKPPAEAPPVDETVIDNPDDALDNEIKNLIADKLEPFDDHDKDAESDLSEGMGPDEQVPLLPSEDTKEDEEKVIIAEDENDIDLDGDTNDAAYDDVPDVAVGATEPAKVEEQASPKPEPIKEVPFEPKLPEPLLPAAAVTPKQTYVPPASETDFDDDFAEVSSESAPPPSRKVDTSPIGNTILSRRSRFEHFDEVPRVKELKHDIQDPVTGEFITLTEYRKRQKETAQGVVREKVEKFEQLDEKALIEKATKKLQDESRAKKPRTWMPSRYGSPALRSEHTETASEASEGVKMPDNDIDLGKGSSSTAVPAKELSAL